MNGFLRGQRNSKKQGDVGLGVAIGWFSSKGYSVSVPLTDSQDYDLVVEMNGKFCAVQVKTTFHTTEYGVYQANLRVFGGNRSGTGKIKYFNTTSTIDYIFVLTERGDMYLIPSSDVTSKATINLGEAMEAYRVSFDLGSGLAADSKPSDEIDYFIDDHGSVFG